MYNGRLFKLIRYQFSYKIHEGFYKKIDYIYLESFRLISMCDKDVDGIYDIEDIVKVPLNKLFLELAEPDEKGISRWVNVTEFTGRYSSLVHKNGGSWSRKDSALAKQYIIERDTSITKGSKIDAYRLNGRQSDIVDRPIRADIRQAFKGERCVVTGTGSQIEIDHKAGNYPERVRNTETQRKDDFQPLCRSLNLIKRQHCKVCLESKKRFDAKSIHKAVSWAEGRETPCDISSERWCKGCYWYDPPKFDKRMIDIKIQEELSKAMEVMSLNDKEDKPKVIVHITKETDS